MTRPIPRLARAAVTGHEATGPIGRAVPLRPVPFGYFDPEVAETKLNPNVKLSVDLDGEYPGHVYGVLAPYDRCILDGQAGCWTAMVLKAADPKLENAQPHQGDTLVDYGDGRIEKLFTANMGGDRGHAPDEPWMPTAKIQSFYEDTSTQLARVRYFWGTHGLCFTGIIWPDVADDPRTLAKMEASGTSLHARPIEDAGGVLGLVGACMVSQPGLPLRRAASVSGDILSYYDGNDFILIDPAPFGGTSMTASHRLAPLDQVIVGDRAAFVASVGLVDVAGDELIGVVYHPDDIYLDRPVAVVHAADVRPTGFRAALTADPVTAAGNPDALRKWYEEGGEGTIRWGTDGAFSRCVAKAGEYMSDEQARGFCAEREHAATGKWPADKAIESAVTAGCGPCGKDNRDVMAELAAGVEPCCDECAEAALHDDQALTAAFNALLASDLNTRRAGVGGRVDPPARWPKGVKEEPGKGASLTASAEDLDAEFTRLAGCAPKKKRRMGAADGTPEAWEAEVGKMSEEELAVALAEAEAAVKDAADDFEKLLAESRLQIVQEVMG